MRSDGGGVSGRTQLLISRSHVPSATARRVFNVVFRSGHFRASRSHRVERRGAPGHEFFYCLSGSGYVLSERKRFRVDPFHLAWLSGLSAHWADQAPWEVLWMRIDGHQIEQAWEVLSVPERPVFAGLPREETRSVFDRVNGLLSSSSVSDAALNCHVAELLGYLVQSRVAPTRRTGRQIRHDAPEIRPALDQMAGDPKRSWRAGELAKICGMSERHFFRRFKMATGLSPIDWLRRERIRIARGKLLEGVESVKEISEQVGYNDVFFFSRDFKHQTGSSPSAYRRERAEASAASKPRKIPSANSGDR